MAEIDIYCNVNDANIILNGQNTGKKTSNSSLVKLTGIPVGQYIIIIQKEGYTNYVQSIALPLDTSIVITTATLTPVPVTSTPVDVYIPSAIVAGVLLAGYGVARYFRVNI